MDEITEQFIIFAKLFRRYVNYHHKNHGKYGNLLQGQGRILSVLNLRPNISQKDLTYLLAVRPQSLGELLVKLEKNHLVERHPAETDRRVMMIHLTDEGKKVAKKLTAGHNIQLFQTLSPEEQTQFIHLLSKLSATLQKELPEGNRHETFYEDPRRHFEMIKQLENDPDKEPGEFFKMMEQQEKNNS